MAHVLIRHKVENYKKWKDSFDAFYNTRKTAGEKSNHVFSLDGDENNVFAIVEYNTKDEAQKFFDSEELKGAMGEAGVVEAPEIYFLNEQSRD